MGGGHINERAKRDSSVKMEWLGWEYNKIVLHNALFCTISLNNATGPINVHLIPHSFCFPLKQSQNHQKRHKTSPIIDLKTNRGIFELIETLTRKLI